MACPPEFSRAAWTFPFQTLRAAVLNFKFPPKIWLPFPNREYC